MSLDLRCLSAGMVLLVLAGIASALPLDRYEPAGQQHEAGQQEEAAKRYQAAGDWMQYPGLPPREARARKKWRSSPYSNQMLSLVDDSVKTFDSRISFCSKDQVCKQAEKTTFNCRCPVYTFCVADGRQYDATCSYSKIGLHFNQPRW